MLKKGMEKSVGQESAGLQQASDMYREGVRPEWSSGSSKGNRGQAGRVAGQCGGWIPSSGARLRLDSC